MYALTAGVVLSLGVISCNKEKQLPEQVSIDALEKKSITEDPATYERFAISLAKTLNEEEVRKFIHDKTMEQFDGDYDILFKDVANHSFTDGSTFIEKLANNDDNANSQEFFESIIENEKRFNIAVPVHCESWECSNFIPLVAIQSKNPETKSFDSNGNIELLDTKTAPDSPVVVVGLNERVDLNGDLLPEIIGGGNGGSGDEPGGIAGPNANRKNCIGCFSGGGGGGSGGGGSGGGGSGGGSGGGGTDLREDKTEEKLYKINIPDLSEVEGWVYGKPEIWVKVTSATGIEIEKSKISPEPKRSEIDNTWYVVDKFITT